MNFSFNGIKPKKIIYNGTNLKKLIYNGVIVWRSDPVVLFDLEDQRLRFWVRPDTPNNGWGVCDCYDSNGYIGSWNQIDCTDYSKCVVRILGYITSEPTGTTSDHTYIRVGFTDDYTTAVDKVDDTHLVHAWRNSSGGEGQDGLAYNRWYDLELDVSALTGVHTLNAFIGGAYANAGYLWCSKITMIP